MNPERRRIVPPGGLHAIPVDPEALRYIPVAFAVMYRMLPVAVADGCLHVVVPESAELPEDSTFAELQSFLRSEFTYETASAEDLQRLIPMHYSAERSEIRNCDVRFRFECPKQWADLHPTDDARVRRCDVCNQDVFFCNTPEELQDRARRNQCVATFDGDLFDGITIGIPRHVGDDGDFGDCEEPSGP